MVKLNWVFRKYHLNRFEHEHKLELEYTRGLLYDEHDKPGSSIKQPPKVANFATA